MDSKLDECPWLIAVHGGAGYHSTDASSEKAHRRVLRSACASAVGAIRSGKKGSIDVVEHAIRVLEDSECLNAGCGSNLTIDGSVECDASIMDGATQDFGSVGAVQEVKNPISLARAIMQNSTKPQPLGRVPPITLVGSGAHSFAKLSDLQLIDSGGLISENARREWEKWKTRLENANLGTEDVKSTDFGSTLASATAPEERQSILEDTVGAVACDLRGGLAAGVSSGGLLLKYPGRIGEAAVFGAGIWAHSLPNARTGVACSVSGTGEAIIRIAFARTLAEAVCVAPPEETHDILQTRLEAFCEEISARGEEPNVGVLVVTKEPFEGDTSSETEFGEDAELSPAPERPVREGTTLRTPSRGQLAEETHHSDVKCIQSEKIKLRLWCAFTTESMAVGYASSEDDKPRALIMRHRTHLNVDRRSSIHIAALPLSR